MSRGVPVGVDCHQPLTFDCAIASGVRPSGRTNRADCHLPLREIVPVGVDGNQPYWSGRKARHIRPITICPYFLLLVFFWAHLAHAETPSYVRLTKNPQGLVTSLDVALVEFSIAEPKVQVDLVSAIHVGDPQYYDELNQLFATYDAVLYELIAPPGHDFSEPRAPNALSMFQNGLKTLLNLEFQLDGVDYKSPNFVHADYSPDEFKRSMDEKGESFVSMFLDLMWAGYTRQLQDPNQAQVTALKMMLGIVSPKRGLVLKRTLAQELSGLEDSMTSISGKNGSTLITARNTKALDVLEQETKTTPHRRFAIFYGAGHMRDMEAQLVKRFGAKRSGERWLRAWRME